MQQPGERDPRHRHAPRRRDLAHHVDAVESTVAVHRREIERRPARPLGAVAVTVVLARQEAARQRAPHHQTQLFGLDQRHQLAFEIAPGDGVIGLKRGEAAETAPIGDAQRLHDPPGGPVGHADIAHMTLADKIVERPHRLFDRRHRIHAVDLVEVDIVGTQPAQAGLDRIHDMPARGAAVIGPVAHLPQNLGRQHHVGARPAGIAHGGAGDLFRKSARIDIGGVDEIDAPIQRPGKEAAAAAEGHGAEAEFRHEQARAAKGVVAHRFPHSIAVVVDKARYGTARPVG